MKSVQLLLAVSVGLSSVGCLNDVVFHDDTMTDPLSGHVELVATDPLRRSFDFERGAYGAVLQDGQIKNLGSHLEYSGYYDDEFSVGISGSDVGIIVNLGHDDYVAERIGVPQTVGSGQGYAALALGEGDRLNDPMHPELMLIPAHNLSLDVTGHERPQLGHVYAARIVREGKTDLVVKMLVVAIVPSERVEFQWARLR